MGVKSNHVQIEQRKLNWKAESKVGSLEKVRRAEALEITLYLPNYRICIWISSSYICANQNNLWPIRQPIALGEATLKLKTGNWNGKQSQRYFLGRHITLIFNLKKCTLCSWYGKQSIIALESPVILYKIFQKHCIFSDGMFLQVGSTKNISHKPQGGDVLIYDEKVVCSNNNFS